MHGKGIWMENFQWNILSCHVRSVACQAHCTNIGCVWTQTICWARISLNGTCSPWTFSHRYGCVPSVTSRFLHRLKPMHWRLFPGVAFVALQWHVVPTMHICPKGSAHATVFCHPYCNAGPRVRPAACILGLLLLWLDSPDVLTATFLRLAAVSRGQTQLMTWMARCPYFAAHAIRPFVISL